MVKISKTQISILKSALLQNKTQFNELGVKIKVYIRSNQKSQFKNFLLWHLREKRYKAEKSSFITKIYEIFKQLEL